MIGILESTSRALLRDFLRADPIPQLVQHGHAGDSGIVSQDAEKLVELIDRSCRHVQEDPLPTAILASSPHGAAQVLLPNAVPGTLGQGDGLPDQFNRVHPSFSNSPASLTSLISLQPEELSASFPKSLTDRVFGPVPLSKSLLEGDVWIIPAWVTDAEVASTIRQ